MHAPGCSCGGGLSELVCDHVRVCACMFVNACRVARVYKLCGREWGGCGASCIQMRQKHQKKNRIKYQTHCEGIAIMLDKYDSEVHSSRY